MSLSTDRGRLWRVAVGEDGPDAEENSRRESREGSGRSGGEGGWFGGGVRGELSISSACFSMLPEKSCRSGFGPILAITVTPAKAGA